MKDANPFRADAEKILRKTRKTLYRYGTRLPVQAEQVLGRRLAEWMEAGMMPMINQLRRFTETKTYVEFANHHWLRREIANAQKILEPYNRKGVI